MSHRCIVLAAFFLLVAPLSLYAKNDNDIVTVRISFDMEPANRGKAKKVRELQENILNAREYLRQYLGNEITREHVATRVYAPIMTIEIPRKSAKKIRQLPFVKSAEIVEGWRKLNRAYKPGDAATDIGADSFPEDGRGAGQYIMIVDFSFETDSWTDINGNDIAGMDIDWTRSGCLSAVPTKLCPNGDFKQIGLTPETRDVLYGGHTQNNARHGGDVFESAFRVAPDAKYILIRVTDADSLYDAIWQADEYRDGTTGGPPIQLDIVVVADGYTEETLAGNCTETFNFEQGAVTNYKNGGGIVIKPDNNPNQEVNNELGVFDCIDGPINVGGVQTDESGGLRKYDEPGVPIDIRAIACGPYSEDLINITQTSEKIDFNSGNDGCGNSYAAPQVAAAVAAVRSQADHVNGKSKLSADDAFQLIKNASDNPLNAMDLQAVQSAITDGYKNPQVDIDSPPTCPNVWISWQESQFEILPFDEFEVWYRNKDNTNWVWQIWSPATPVGCAFFNKRAGLKVKIKGPFGESSFTEVFQTLNCGGPGGGGGGGEPLP